MEYVVPTGRVVVPAGRYIVPAGKVILIVSTGRLSLVPTGRILSPGKFPYLKKDEYEVWAMKMEYWITNNDMNIWKVIQNGNSLKRTGRDCDGRVIILPPTTADEHIAVQRESKARTTLLQSIPDDHVADFHYMDDARDIWNAVKARFGGNAESKKMRKSMLKQEFSEFRISEAEGLHKGYDRMQKILSQLNQLKAKPEDEDINLKFLRALPSSWSQVALTLKTKGGLELLSFDDLYYKLKTLEVDIKGYSTFSSSQSAGPSHSAFVSTTSASKKMSYADSPSYSSSTYTAPSNSKTGSHRSGNVIEDVLQSFVADTEPEQQLAYEDFEGWDDSAFSVFTTNSEEVEGRPHFNRFAKTDSIKVVPPPLFGDYTPLSDHTDLDESQMYYGTKSSTSGDSNSVSNDYVSCDNNDKSLEVNSNDFASSDSSVKSLEPKSNDSTSYASTSSISTSESEAEFEELIVGTPIQRNHLIRNHVNHQNQFVPISLTSLRLKIVSIPPGSPQPVPTGKPKVPAPVPTSRQNRSFPVPTNRGDSPSVASGGWQSTARPMPYLIIPTSSYFQTYTPYVPQVYSNHMQYGGVRWATALSPQQIYKADLSHKGLGSPLDTNFSHVVYCRKILIQMLKIHTDDNVADLLTKAFDGPKFNHLVVNIGMLNP
ncbi:hypothetical protein Tco_1409242 [Tanacetum coccineum]